MESSGVSYHVRKPRSEIDFHYHLNARNGGLIIDNDNYYCLRVLSGDQGCYGAASAQILAIYENFRVFAVSVLLLANSLF